MESPVKGDFRLSRRATTVGGVEIPAGTTVMVLNGAAGRDPRRFEDPDEFRVDRANAREHLAFGRGPHSCPGGPLARAEARISIERILGRMEDITDLGVGARTGGRPALRVRPDVHPPWPPAAASSSSPRPAESWRPRTHGSPPRPSRTLFFCYMVFRGKGA